MTVDVDEAGRHVEAGNVEHAPALLGGDGADGRDPIAHDADVGRVAWQAGTIEHQATADDQVEARCGDNRRGPKGGSRDRASAESHELSPSDASGFHRRHLPGHGPVRCSPF
jgi:hypothetical protein